MKTLKSLAVTAAFVCASAAQAVTVLQPTSDDVDFTEISFFGIEISSGDLYVFDNDTTTYDVSNGLQVVLGGQVDFDFLNNIASNANGSITLTDDTSFKVALLDGGVWSEDVAFTFYGEDTGVLSFGADNNVFLSDVTDVQEVPVPAAAWLFGSAMLGLAGVKRRK